MTSRIDLSGQTVGCYSVVAKAPTRFTPSMKAIGYWVVRCSCGNERQMRAQKLLHLKDSDKQPIVCAPSCTNAHRTVYCSGGCGREKLISVRKKRQEWRCHKCYGKVLAGTKRGFQVANKLPLGVALTKDLYSSYARGANNRGLSFKLTIDEFKSFIDKDCHYCGVPPSSVRKRKGGTLIYNGIDRMDPKIGYVLDNCVPCCSKCNYMKSDMTKEEFMSQVAAIYSRFAQRDSH